MSFVISDRQSSPPKIHLGPIFMCLCTYFSKVPLFCILTQASVSIWKHLYIFACLYNIYDVFSKTELTVVNSRDSWMYTQ